MEVLPLNRFCKTVKRKYFELRIRDRGYLHYDTMREDVSLEILNFSKMKLIFSTFFNCRIDKF